MLTCLNHKTSWQYAHAYFEVNLHKAKSEPHDAGNRIAATLKPMSHGFSMVWLIAFFLLAGAIFIEALHAPTIDGSVIPNLDKVAHATAFGLMTFLLLRSLLDFGCANSWRLLLGVGLSVAALGVLDEWVQASVPGRTASIADWLADAVGVASILLVVSIVEKKRDKC